MGSFFKSIDRLLHGLIAICLSLMAIFVFGNVILRYFFNSGLTWAEEASRYLFIWLIFLGAIVAFKENAHLGVDTLVQRLSAKGRKVLFLVNNLLILITMALVVEGTFKLTLITANQNSASMGIPLAFVYSSGFIGSVAMLGIAIGNLYRLVTNKLNAGDLVMITDSEDNAKVEQAVSEAAKGDAKL